MKECLYQRWPQTNWTSLVLCRMNKWAKPQSNVFSSLNLIWDDSHMTSICKGMLKVLFVSRLWTQEWTNRMVKLLIWAPGELPWLATGRAVHSAGSKRGRGWARILLFETNPNRVFICFHNRFWLVVQRDFIWFYILFQYISSHPNGVQHCTNEGSVLLNWNGKMQLGSTHISKLCQVAAYLLDHKHFAGVPLTTLVTQLRSGSNHGRVVVAVVSEVHAKHPAFVNPNKKAASGLRVDGKKALKSHQLTNLGLKKW